MGATSRLSLTLILMLTLTLTLILTLPLTPYPSPQPYPPSRPTDAQHTEAIAALCAKAPHALLLSGTPSLRRPFQLWRQAFGLGLGLGLELGVGFSVSVRASVRERVTPPAVASGGAGCAGPARAHQVGLRPRILLAAARTLGRRASRCREPDLLLALTSHPSTVTPHPSPLSPHA